MSYPTRAHVQITKPLVATLIAEVVTDWGEPGWLSVQELWTTLEGAAGDLIPVEHPLRQALIELELEGLIEPDLSAVCPFNQYCRWTGTMHDKAAIYAQLDQDGGA